MNFVIKSLRAARQESEPQDFNIVSSLSGKLNCIKQENKIFSITLGILSVGPILR